MFRRLARHIAIFSFVLAFGSVADTAHADGSSPEDAFARMASGHSGLKELGSEFYTAARARTVVGAELLLADLELLEGLGVDVSDPARLEAAALKHFALEMTDGADGREYFATNYIVDKTVAPTEGDGRLIWLGQVELPGVDGKPVFLDVTVKGIGPVKGGKKDGLLSQTEGIFSYLTSRMNRNQRFDSTGDAFVFRIPTKKIIMGDETPAAISVRIGPQFRPAHFGYHAMAPKQLGLLIDSMIERNTGTKVERGNRTELFIQYVKSSVVNSAEDGARMDDSNFKHGMLHQSNFTENGGSIDFGTSFQSDGYSDDTGRYLHRHFVDIMLEYLGIESVHRSGRPSVLSSYSPKLPPDVLKKAGFNSASIERIRSELNLQAMQELYRSVKTRLAEELRLSRIGLTQSQIQAVRPETRTEFLQKAWRLRAIREIDETILDVHGVLRSTPEFMRRRSANVMELAKDDRVGWPRRKRDLMRPALEEYVQIVKKIEAELGDRLDWNRASLRAAQTLARVRVRGGWDFETSSMSRFTKSLKSPGKPDWQALSRMANRIADDRSHWVGIPRQYRSRQYLGDFVSRPFSEKRRCIEEELTVRHLK